jgi:hypothetical protein
MAPLNFDIPGDPPSAVLDAAVANVSVIDLDGNPNRVIDTDTGFRVQVRWLLTGALAPLIINDWHVRLFAESIGDGFEGKLAETTAVTPTAIPNGVQLDATLTVSAADIAARPNMVNNEGDGVYQLVVVITHDNVFNLRDELAGFAESVVIEVRKP